MEHGKHVATSAGLPGRYRRRREAAGVLPEEQGLVYAMFETSTFHDDLYAMEKLSPPVCSAISSTAKGVLPSQVDERATLGSYKDWRKKGCPMWYPTHATAYYIGVTHQSFVDVSCQGTPYADQSLRVPNAIGNIFRSEVGPVPHHGRRPVPHDGLQFAGRIPGSGAHPGRVCRVQQDVCRRRGWQKALRRGDQERRADQEVRLAAGVRRAVMAARTATSATTSSTPFSAAANRAST